VDLLDNERGEIVNKLIPKLIQKRSYIPISVKDMNLKIN
jgi:hypothetical protein